MATEADIPEAISITKGETEDRCLTSRQFDKTVDESSPVELEHFEGVPNQPPDTVGYSKEAENTQQEACNVGVKTMSNVTKSNIETSEGESFLESSSAAKVASGDTISVHCQADEIANQAEKDKSENENQLQKEGKLEAFEEKRSEEYEVIDKKESENHDIVSVANTYFEKAKTNELAQKVEGEETLGKTDENIDFESNKQDINLVETTSDQNKESFFHAPDLTVNSLDKDVEGVTQTCNKDESMENTPSASSALIQEELQETSFEGVDDKESEKSSNLVNEQKGPEAISATENISNEIDAKQKIPYESIGDASTPTLLATPGIQNGQEEIIQIEEGSGEKIDRPPATLATDCSNIEEAGVEVGEDLKEEGSSVECIEKTQDTIKASQIKKNVVPVEDDKIQEKNDLDAPSETQADEMCKVDNPEIFKEISEIVPEDTIKKSPKEVEDQTEILEKHGEYMQCESEGLTRTEAAAGDKEEGFTDVLINAVKHGDIELAKQEEDPENSSLQKTEPEKETLERSLNVGIADEIETAASRENAETKESPRDNLEESFEERGKEDQPNNKDDIIKTANPTEKSLPLIDSNEEIESEEVEISSTNYNELQATHSSIKETVREEGENLDEVSKFEPVHGHESNGTSAEKDKHIENTSTEVAEIIETISTTGENAGKLDSEENLEVKDGGGDIKEIGKKDEHCSTEPDKIESQSDDTEQGIGEEHAPFKVQSAVCSGHETVEKNLQVQIMEEAAPNLNAEDESSKPDDSVERNNIVDVEVHDGLKIAGTEEVSEERIVESNVTSLLPESIEEETIKNFQENEKEAEMSQAEETKEQILIEGNVKDLLLQSTGEGPTENFKDEEKEAQKSQKQIIEESETVGAAESIVHETNQDNGSPETILGTSLVKQVEIQQGKDENLAPMEASTEDKREEDMHIENTSEAYQRRESTILEHTSTEVAETMKMISTTSENAGKLESEETLEVKDGGEDIEKIAKNEPCDTETDKTERKSYDTEEGIGEENAPLKVQSIVCSVNETVEKSLEVEILEEAALNLNAEDESHRSDDVEKKNIIDVEVHDGLKIAGTGKVTKEQIIEGNVTQLVPESIEDETIKNSQDNEKEAAEMSQGEETKEQIIIEGTVEDLLPQSIGEGATEKLKDKENEVEKSQKQIIEESETVGAAESIEHETNQDNGSPETILGTSLVKQVEIHQGEDENLASVEASTEDKREEDRHIENTSEAYQRSESTILEHTSTEVAETMEMISTTSENAGKLESEENLEVKDVGEDTEKIAKKDEPCDTETDKTEPKSDDTEEGICEENAPLKVQSTACSVNETVEKSLEVEILEEAAPNLNAEDESHISDDVDKKNIIDVEVHDGLKIAGTGEVTKEQIIEGSVTHLVPESIEEETIKNSQDNKEAEMSQGGETKEQIIIEGTVEDLLPQSTGEGATEKLKDKENEVEKSQKQIIEESETARAADLGNSLVKQEEIQQGEEENLAPVETSTDDKREEDKSSVKVAEEFENSGFEEDKVKGATNISKNEEDSEQILQKAERGDKVEGSENVMSEETEACASSEISDKITNAGGDEAIPNLEETSDVETKEEKRKDSNDGKENETANKEVLEPMGWSQETEEQIIEEIVKDKSPESTEKQIIKEYSEEDPVCEGQETAVSSMITEKQNIEEEAITVLSSYSVEEETVTKNSKEEESDALKSKEEVRSINLELKEQIEATSSTEETKYESFKDRTETNKNHDDLSVAETSAEETHKKESIEISVENSSFVTEVPEKEVKGEILKNEESTLNYSDYALDTVAPELKEETVQKSLKEDKSDAMKLKEQVEGINLEFKEQTEATSSTDETKSETFEDRAETNKNHVALNIGEESAKEIHTKENIEMSVENSSSVTEVPGKEIKGEILEKEELTLNYSDSAFDPVVTEGMNLKEAEPEDIVQVESSDPTPEEKGPATIKEIGTSLDSIGINVKPEDNSNLEDISYNDIQTVADETGEKIENEMQNKAPIQVCERQETEVSSTITEKQNIEEEAIAVLSSYSVEEETVKKNSMEEESDVMNLKQEVCERQETEVSSTITEKQNIEEEAIAVLSSYSVEEETVKKNSMEEESDVMNLKQEVEDINLEIKEHIEATRSTEETKSETFEGGAEPNKNHVDLNIAEASAQEIHTKEGIEISEKNSSSETEVPEKEIKGEILEREEPTLKYSDSAFDTVATEEMNLKEAEPEDIIQIKSSDPAPEEKGLTTIEAQGTSLGGVGVNVKTEDDSNLKEIRYNDNQNATDESGKNIENGMQYKAPNTGSENQKKGTTSENPLDCMLEDKLQDPSTKLSKDDTSDEMKLKEAVEDINLEFKEQIEATSSTEETKSQTFEDREETNKNHDALNIAESSTEEIHLKERVEISVESSSCAAEVPEKEIKGEMNLKEETVQKNSKEGESDATESKEEVESTNLEFKEQIEETSSADETKSVTFEGGAEPNKNHDALNIVEASAEEINTKESIENSSVVTDVPEKDIKGEILEKEESTLNYSGSTFDTVATEEMNLKEDETEEIIQVKSSDPAPEEKGAATMAAEGISLDSVAINLKPEDNSNLKEIIYIQTVADATGLENEMQEKAPNMGSENPKEETTSDDVLEDNLLDPSTMPSKESDPVTTEASKTTETPVRNETPYENAETPIIVQKKEEKSLQQEDESSTPNDVPEMELLDTGKVGANQELQKHGDEELYVPPESQTEKNISEFKREEPNDLVDQSEIYESETLREEGSLNLGLEKSKPEDEETFAEASKCSVVGTCTDSEKAILEEEDSAKNFEGSLKETIEVEKVAAELEAGARSHGCEATNTKDNCMLTKENLESADPGEELKCTSKTVAEDQGSETLLGNKSQVEENSNAIQDQSLKYVEQQIDGQKFQGEKNTEEEMEPELEAGDHISKTQIENETIKTVIFNEEVHKGVGKAGEDENIKEQVIEEESDLKELHTAFDEDETVGKISLTAVKDSDPLLTEYVEATEADEQTKIVNLELEENPTREREASVVKDSEGEELQEKDSVKTVDVTIAVAGDSGQKIKEEIDNPHDKVDVATVTDVISETTLGETHLDDKPIKDSDNKSLQAININAKLRDEVDRVMFEETSSDTVSQHPTTDHENAEKDNVIVEKTDVGEDEGIERAPESVFNLLVEASDDSVQCQTEEKMDADKTEEETKEASESANQTPFSDLLGTGQMRGTTTMVEMRESSETADQTLPAGKSEEELPKPSSSLEQEHGTTTVEKIEKENKNEVETLEDEDVENFSTEKTTEEECLNKEDPKVHEVNNLGLELNKDIQRVSPNVVHEEESTTHDGLEPQGNVAEINDANSTVESEKITELPRSVEEASKFKFETSENASESMSEVHHHDVLTKLEDTEIKEKHLEAAMTDLRTDDIRSEKTIEGSQATEIIKNEVSNEEITEGKEVRKESHQIPLGEETMIESHQEDELKADNYPGGNMNEAINATVDGIQNEEQYEATLRDEEVDRVKLEETSSVPLSQHPTTDPENAEKKNETVEKLDVGEDEESERAPESVFNQVVEAGDDSVQCQIDERLDADKIEEETKEASESTVQTFSEGKSEQKLQTPFSTLLGMGQMHGTTTKVEMKEASETADQTLAAGKSEELLQKPSPSLPFKEQEHGTTSVEKIEKENSEEETLDDGNVEDSSMAKTIEGCLNKEDPKELEVSNFELELNKDVQRVSPKGIHEEKGITPDGLEPQGNVAGTEGANSTVESEKITELPRPVEDDSEFKFETSEEASEYMSEAHNHGVLAKLEDSEIKEKHLEAAITDLSTKDIQSEKIIEAIEITMNEVSNEKIPEEMEVSKESLQIPLGRETILESHKVDELEGDNYPGANMNEAIKTTVDGLQNEKQSKASLHDEEVDRAKLEESSSDLVSQHPTTDHENTEKDKTVENSDVRGDKKIEIAPESVMNQVVEESDDSEQSRTEEKVHADKLKEEKKEASEVGDQTFPTGKSEEQLQKPSSSVLFKEHEHGITTVEKIEKENVKEAEMLEDENVEDSSTAKSTEEGCLSKEDPKELEVSNLGLELNKDIQRDSPTRVPEEEGITQNGLESQGSVAGIKNANSIAESEKITELPIPVEEAPKFRFEKSENTCKSMTEVHNHDDLTKLEDTEIKEKHLEAEITDPRTEEIQSEKSVEAIDIRKDEVSNEEIPEEKDVSKESHQIPLGKETMIEGHQEDELKADNYLGENTNEAIKTTVDGVQNEQSQEFGKPSTSDDIEKHIVAEDIIVEDSDIVFVENETTKEKFPDEAEGKTAKETAIIMDHENQGGETNSGNSTSEGTTPREEELGIQIQQKEVTMVLIEANEITEDIQQLDKSSCATSERQFQREADSNESTETVISTGNKYILPAPQDPIAETLQKAEAGDLEPGSATGVISDAKRVEHRGENIMGGSVEKTTEDPTSMDSGKISLSSLMQKSGKESLQAAAHMTGEREPTASGEEMHAKEAERVAVKETRTDEEKEEEEEEEGDEHHNTESGSDAPVMVEASRDMDVKVPHKKSHNILSGVGSRVKHSIAKVKKAITGKSSHPKTVSSK